jgi:hypothetical protein
MLLLLSTHMEKYRKRGPHLRIRDNPDHNRPSSMIRASRNLPGIKARRQRLQSVQAGYVTYAMIQWHQGYKLKQHISKPREEPE